jgi:hypothetical protein
MYLEKNTEQNSLIQNLINYFPVSPEGRTCFFGRTGMFRGEFDELVKYLEFQKLHDDERPECLNKYSIEKVLFMALWCTRLKKNAYECSTLFNVIEEDVIKLMKWTKDFLPTDIVLKKTPKVYPVVIRPKKPEQEKYQAKFSSPIVSKPLIDYRGEDVS